MLRQVNEHKNPQEATSFSPFCRQRSDYLLKAINTSYCVYYTP